jgi:hypothetical protein
MISTSIVIPNKVVFWVLITYALFLRNWSTYSAAKFTIFHKKIHTFSREFTIFHEIYFFTGMDGKQS